MTEPLNWIRWGTDTHRDADLLDLPKKERWIWPTLCDLAAKGDPHGTVRHNVEQISREADLSPKEVLHSIGLLIDRGRVRIADGVLTVVNFNPRYGPPQRLLPPDQRSGPRMVEEPLAPVEQKERDRMLRELAAGMRMSPRRGPRS